MKGRARDVGARLAPQSIPLAQSRVGVPPLSSQNGWPQAQLRSPCSPWMGGASAPSTGRVRAVKAEASARLAGADSNRKETKWRCPTGECKPASRWAKAEGCTR
jgi:hypothetical protein